MTVTEFGKVIYSQLRLHCGYVTFSISFSFTKGLLLYVLPSLSIMTIFHHYLNLSHGSRENQMIFTFLYNFTSKKYLFLHDYLIN